jgi:hypothetical protein
LAKLLYYLGGVLSVDVSTTLSDLGYAEVTLDHLGVMVGRCLGVANPRLTTVQVAPVAYPYGSIATGALMRCSGTAVVGAERRRWSAPSGGVGRSL